MRHAAGVSHFPGQPRPFEAGGCDDYPVRVCCFYPIADRPNPSPRSPLTLPNLDEPKKERKKTDNPREGWKDGTPPPHRDFKERGVLR